MGKSKQLRKKIAGHRRNIKQHEQKIEHELTKPEPNVRLIRKWEKDIDRARTRMRELEERLEK